MACLQLDSGGRRATRIGRSVRFIPPSALYRLEQAELTFPTLVCSRVTTESATGSTSSHRVHLKLTIQVDRVLYSALAQNADAAAAAAADPANASSAQQVASSSGTAGTTTLHISGRITSENEHVKKGAFHTLDLEMGRDFTVIKGEGEWDSVALERLQDMTEPGRGADVGAIVCGEGAYPPS